MKYGGKQGQLHDQAWRGCGAHSHYPALGWLVACRSSVQCMQHHWVTVASRTAAMLTVKRSGHVLVKPYMEAVVQKVT